jgi:hypothetical protein
VGSALSRGSLIGADEVGEDRGTLTHRMTVVAAVRRLRDHAYPFSVDGWLSRSPRSRPLLPGPSALHRRRRETAEREQRKANRAEADSLKQQRRDAKRAQSKLHWGRDWKALDKLQRDLGAQERRLRKTK